MLDACGDFRANAIDFGDVFFLRGDERVNRREFRGDNFADAFANMANAQGEQHAAKRLLLRFLQLIVNFRRGFRADGNGVACLDAALGVGRRIEASRVERGDVFDAQLVEIAYVAHEPGFEHLVDDFLAQAVDIHAAAAYPVQQALLGLRGAIHRHAAIGDFPFVIHHGASARGTVRGHIPLNGAGGALFQYGANDLGNHVAGFVHYDGVAHAHVLAANLVDVVQCGARDGRTGHGNGVEFGDGSEHAGAAHLNANFAQDGLLFFWRELECDGPSRRAGGKAQVGLLFERVDLHHHAVDVVIEVGAMGERVRAELMHLGRRGAAFCVGVYRKARVAQPIQELALRMHVQGVGARDGIEERGQIALGGDFRVFLSKRACGGVARVRERRASFGVGFLIEAREAALGHIDLAAHLDARVAIGAHMREARFRQVHGHVADGAHVERNVFAGRAVAARGGANEGTIFIGERYAQAVDFQLAGVRGLARAQRVFGALQPFVELGQVHGVVHGIHARHVGDGRELLAHVAAHALRVAVGRDQVGELRLDALQLDEQLVEGAVGDFRRVERVIAIGMVVEQMSQLGRARGGLRVLGRIGGSGVLLARVLRWMA